MSSRSNGLKFQGLFGRLSEFKEEESMNRAPPNLQGENPHLDVPGPGSDRINGDRISGL